MHVAVLTLLFVVGSAYAARCPPVFGEFECPIGYTCKDSQCYGRNGSPSTVCGFETDCSEGTICVEGKCYPHSAIKCNRHVLVAEGQARSIVSDCGKKGKCVNGQSPKLSAWDMQTADQTWTVDQTDAVFGRVQLNLFFNPSFKKNRQLSKRVINILLEHLNQSATASQTKFVITDSAIQMLVSPQRHKSPLIASFDDAPFAECTSIFCGKGSYCVDGKCVNGVGVDCREENCRGGTVCVNGVCVLDPCPASCPADQSCRLGECRIMEGLPCVEECSGPYTCVDGHCRRNDCERRVCQLGEACESGQCQKVTGRFCTWAPRDCGHAFACKENQCVDMLTPFATLPPHQDNRLPNNMWYPMKFLSSVQENNVMHYEENMMKKRKLHLFAESQAALHALSKGVFKKAPM
ncbi:Hemadin protein [Ancylostoma ceylanicum]|uniref:Hemadin protein n=1 Tax=Ancylostoma ceylanicum TaxID=53326 RepID=A0A0D6LQB1_9BILA|nr:Hemadin protein [Ancylostoma ceylanicum]